MNTQIPNKYILSIKPKKYLTQGISHCGAYCIKAILSAYGRDTKTHPKYYHPNILGRLTGTTLGKNYYANILRSYNIDAEVRSAKQYANKEKITLLKSILASNTPVMVRIGNGYRTNIHNPLLGKIIAHWITLWGYDDNNQLFYIYDSALPTRYWSKNIPTGNTTRTYQEILRDWNFGNIQFWYWPLVGRDTYTYIQIHKT